MPRRLRLMITLVVSPLLLLTSIVAATVATSGTAQASSCNTTATYSWTNNCQVSEGSVNRMVEVVQMIVQDQEVCSPLVGAVDGDFGPKTTAGVECFQRFFGDGVDGTVGPQTWGTLQAGLFKCSEISGFQYYSPIFPCPGTSGHTDPIREYLSTGIWWFFSPISNEWWRINTTAPV